MKNTKVITPQNVRNHYVIDDNENIWIAPNHWLLIQSNQGNHIGHNRQWELDDYHYSKEALRAKFLSSREALDSVKPDPEAWSWDIDGYTWKIIPYYEIMDVLHRTGTSIGELWAFNLETDEHINEFYTWLMDGGGWPGTGMPMTDENIAIVLNQMDEDSPIYLEFLQDIGRPAI